MCYKKKKLKEIKYNLILLKFMNIKIKYKVKVTIKRRVHIIITLCITLFLPGLSGHKMKNKNLYIYSEITK